MGKPDEGVKPKECFDKGGDESDEGVAVSEVGGFVVKGGGEAVLGPIFAFERDDDGGSENAASEGSARR